MNKINGVISVVCFAVLFFHPCTSAFCSLKHKGCDEGSDVGKIFDVSFNGTCQDGKAKLKQGTEVLIDFKFQAFNPEEKLTSKVYGKIGVLPYVSFPLSNPDACKDSGLKCPIKANQTYDFQPLLDVKTEYPKVQVIVKWELLDKDEKKVFCVLMPAFITA